MSDYTPVPEADLEASFMETLALLRQNSTDGRAAMSGLQRLTEQLASEAYRRGLEHKNVMSMLDAVNTTLKESNVIIANSRPLKKTRIELTKDILTIILMLSIAISALSVSILLAAKALQYFNPI